MIKPLRVLMKAKTEHIGQTYVYIRTGRHRPRRMCSLEDLSLHRALVQNNSMHHLDMVRSLGLPWLLEDMLLNLAMVREVGVTIINSGTYRG